MPIIKVVPCSRLQPICICYLIVLQGPVSKAAIPDYNEFVKTEDEMHLDQIKRQISDYHYACADKLREDLAQIQTNAKAYNTEGKGKWGNGGGMCTGQLVDWRL